MKKRFILFGLLFFFYHTSFAQQRTQEFLYGNWYVTYIENRSDTLVCRKYNTPPYDWGTTYIFNKDGTFVNSLSSDEDTSLAMKGTWVLNEENNLLTLNSSTNSNIQIQIVAISEKVMHILILQD